MAKLIGDSKFYKKVFTIILPIMLQQLFLSLAGYIDNIMINSYGSNAAAYNGVSAANRLTFVFNFVCLGLVSAVCIFTSQFFGAKNKDKVKETVRLSMYCTIIFGIICFLVTTFFGNRVVDSYILDPEARQFGYDYLKQIRWGIVLTCLTMSFANSYRSIQKPNIPLFIGIIGILVNIFFNWIFIFGSLGAKELGATGAALATNISKAVEAILYIISFKVFKVDYINGMLKEFKVTKSLLKDFIKRGTPVVLNELCWSLSMVIMTKFLTYNNDMWYNAYAYTQNISDLFFVVFSGLGNGTAILIGSALGDSDFERAEREMNYFRGLGIGMGLFVGILMIVTSPLTSRMFTSDEEVIKLMMSILSVTGVFTAVYCYNSVCFFTLRAGGDSIRAICLDQVPIYVIGLPIVIFFGVNTERFGMTIVHVYLLSHIVDFLKIFIASFFIKQKKWLKNLTIAN